MQTRTKGIQVTESGDRIIEKQYKGERIFARLGAVSQENAEAWLRANQAEIDLKREQSKTCNFGFAAGRYLTECERRKVRSIEDIAYHINLVLPYIGHLPLDIVHTGSLQSFCDHRIDVDKVSPRTVNFTLEIVRTILIRSARVWRGEDGKPWLGTAPLIEMLDTNGTRRQPYPISWAEQGRLFSELPEHVQRMAQFAVNTGLRDENVCGLEWSWERYIPELKRSVFVIPASVFKSKRPHVAILNDAAMNMVEMCRGFHPQYVFAYKNKKKHIPVNRIETMNNSAWQKARKRAGLPQVRVHDLRHTFAQRLRDAGISNEDRAVLMGHAAGNMSEHYATPTIQRLVEMANMVFTTRDTPTLLRVING